MNTGLAAFPGSATGVLLQPFLVPMVWAAQLHSRSYPFVFTFCYADGKTLPSRRFARTGQYTFLGCPFRLPQLPSVR